MNLIAWLRRAFPLERRTAAGGVTFGFLLALILWLPLPDSVRIPGWLPLVLWAALAVIFFGLCRAGRSLLAPPEALGWRGLGLAAAGVMLSFIPLGETVRTTAPPMAFLIAGLLLAVVRLAKTRAVNTEKQ